MAKKKAEYYNGKVNELLWRGLDSDDDMPSYDDMPSDDGDTF